VYSFGCTLYQLLSGYDPGSTPFYLPPLDTRNPRVSAPVQSAILRATKLDRDQRYQSVEEFARDLNSGQQSSTANPAASKGGRGTGAGVGAAARVAQPTMAAVVVVQPQTIDFGSLVAGQRGTQSFTVGGQGNIPVRGKIKVLSPWLSLDRDQFDGPSTLVQLVAETSKIPKAGKQISSLQIDCDRQHLYVPVMLSVLSAPVPVTRVVPAVGVKKVAGQSMKKGQGGASARPGGPARAPAPSPGAQSKYRSPMVGTPRRDRLPRFCMSLALALGCLSGAMVLLHWLAQPHRLPVPMTLPVVLGILLGITFLASGVAIAGSGGPGWHGRFLTTLIGATLAAVLVVLGNGPYPWAGIYTILHVPVKVSSVLIVWTTLAVSGGAALGAEPTISRWMLATIGLIGRFPRGFIALVGAIGAGIACHNLALASKESYWISCATIVGALIGGIIAYRIAGAMRSLARVRP
jgi:hypothetical protein